MEIEQKHLDELFNSILNKEIDGKVFKDIYPESKYDFYYTYGLYLIKNNVVVAKESQNNMRDSESEYCLVGNDQLSIKGIRYKYIKKYTCYLDTWYGCTSTEVYVVKK